MGKFLKYFTKHCIEGQYFLIIQKAFFVEGENLVTNTDLLNFCLDLGSSSSDLSRNLTLFVYLLMNLRAAFFIKAFFIFFLPILLTGHQKKPINRQKYVS